MNVVDYTEAGFRLSTSLINKLCEVDAKYVRVTLSDQGVIAYEILSAADVSCDDYVIRLDSSTNLVLSTYAYSRILHRKIGVTEGLKGTELVFE